MFLAYYFPFVFGSVGRQVVYEHSKATCRSFIGLFCLGDFRRELRARLAGAARSVSLRSQQAALTASQVQDRLTRDFRERSERLTITGEVSQLGRFVVRADDKRVVCWVLTAGRGKTFQPRFTPVAQLDLAVVGR